ncbi:MAG: hypothetical protein IT426_11275 [Pirellulales bacterium]|nr:hypothetical protein [Pirellulales bacterium]
MSFLPSALFSLLLLLVSGGLMLAHRRSWKAFRREEMPQEEFDYRRRQFRRRMQASGAIGIVGIALFVGVAFFLGRESLASGIENAAAIAAYWFAVLLLTVWMALLAFADVWASRRYVDRILDRDLREQTKLHAGLYRQRRENIELQNTDGGVQRADGEARDARD